MRLTRTPTISTASVVPRGSLDRRSARPACAWLALALLVVACSPPAPPQRPQPASWTGDGVTFAYLGHASVLIDFGGTMLLTDPTLNARIGLSLGPLTIGPKRQVACALTAEELPKLSAVLVSHAHMDSLDRPSLARLSATPMLVVPERTRDLVSDLGYAEVVELPWGKTVEAGGVTIEAVEVSHWGRRWPWDGWRGYDGFLLSRGDVRVLFASDTAFSRKLAEYARSRHVTVAILGIGAYDPWVWNHETPEEAWETFLASGAEALIPIHWDTFRLGKEPLGESMRRLLAAAGEDSRRVVIREIGGTWRLARSGPT
jgi:L-ascorbate metabolism protein UlaG (beta-lactamase superfamily)